MDSPHEEPRHIPTAPRQIIDGRLIGAMGRHPTALGVHLDHYLSAVARELEIRGVLIGTPQRTNPAQRLLGSIVIDCTALRVDTPTPRADRPAQHQALGATPDYDHPAPVILTWDEDLGWCVGLHHDPSHSSRRYLHPELLPTPDTVADFVVGLALGQPLGSAQPITTHRSSDPPKLRLIR